MQSDTKRQKLLECVLTRNSKLYLGKVHTEDQLKKLNDEEVENLFNNYEAKLSGQLEKSLGHSIINMYLMGACAVLGISNQDVLSEDLQNDPFLNSTLQRFTCELYHRFGSFLAPLSVGLITSRHYLSECNGRTSGTSGTNGTEGAECPTSRDKQKLLGSGPLTSSKNMATELMIGAALAAELMVGFWFAVEAILAIKMVNSLEELISRK